METIDSKSIKDYIVDLDSIYTKIIDNKVSNRGLTTVIKEHLGYLDCTRVWQSGLRPMQTPFYPYRLEVSTLLYLIDKLQINEMKTMYYNRLIKQHEINLKFEEANPPVMYDKRQTKVVKQRKHRPVLTEEEKKKKAEKKEQAKLLKELKHSAKISKLNMLSLKPIKHEM